MEKQIEKTVPKKCDLCGAKIFVDDYALGHCENCGWANVELAVMNPTKVFLPNLLSLHNAKQLYREKSALKPSFDQLVEILELNNNILFYYNDKCFEIACLGDYIEFLDVERNFATSFDSIEEFSQNASIENISLYTLWDKVEVVERLHKDIEV